MKKFLEELFKREDAFQELNIFYDYDIESIKKFDDQFKDLKISDIDVYLEMNKKPNFSNIEKRYNITIHEELREYWSQFWRPLFTLKNKKAITDNHIEEKIFVNLLSSPLSLRELEEDVEMHTEEMNQDGHEGVFFPIAYKEDDWNILFNNTDGSIYIQEHDPTGSYKIANSIKEFYSL